MGAAMAWGSSRIVAAPEERELSFYHIHTKETLTVVYKRDGQYIPEAMDKIDWFLRDWRRNEATKMDRRTIDILWEIHTELGSKEAIHIISGYRSPATNEMLRRTQGGQAKNSNHIRGLAVDAYFPDVDPRFPRYAALQKERGGVGYYPTSALPFVHVDTGRVRHWPKMGKDELALVFPSGRSKHISSGGALRPGDYERAQKRSPEIAKRLIAFTDLRNAVSAGTTLVASSEAPAESTAKPAGKVAALVTNAGPKPVIKVAALDTTPEPKPLSATAAPGTKPQPTIKRPVVASLGASPGIAPQQSEPKLVAAPRLVERTSRFLPGPSVVDRKGLDHLVKLAAFEPAADPKLVVLPKPAVRPAKYTIAPEPLGPPAPADTLEEGSYDPEAAETGASSLTGTGFVAAPAFDPEHPEELAYRPFPLAPLMTASASPDDPVLAKLSHPELARTLEIIDDVGAVQPMRFRPQKQVAELLFAQQFRGGAVQRAPSAVPAGDEAPTGGISERAVRTVMR
jgi:uncharacterized protein YcbK (DUF882 family)